MSPRILTPIEDRFWAKVDKTETCWNWTGYVKPDGHGELGVGRRGQGQVLAHVFSFKLHGGVIEPNKFVLHRCNNARCVNPEHLYAGTKSENLYDAYRAGRRRWNAEKMHCPRFHPYNEENTYVTKEGKRQCRQCARGRHNAS